MVRLLVLWLFVWWCLPFVFWFLKFVSLNDFLRFNPFLVQWPYGGTPLRAKPSSMETFRGISLAHRIPFCATMHPMGLTKGRHNRMTNGPTGEHPFGPVQNFPSSPSSSPSHFITPSEFLKPLKFQIGLDRKSEHLTNFDIRSSGDFSAGKPHVSVGRSLKFRTNFGHV